MHAALERGRKARKNRHEPDRFVRAAHARASGAHSDVICAVLDDLAGHEAPVSGFLAALARRRILRVDVSLFGILRTSKPELETAIETARRQASLSKRILFLSRTKQVFNLWHVVHRPFSYSFAILAILHIVVVLGMGYR